MSTSGTLLIAIPSHNRGNVILDVIDAAIVAGQQAQERLIDDFLIYVYLNDNTDDTPNLIDRHEFPEGVKEPIIEEKMFGVKDRFDGEYRNKFIRAVMCQKYNRCIDLGEAFDYMVMVSSDHIVAPNCIRSMIAASLYLHADVVGPVIDSTPHNKNTNLYRRKPSGLYGRVEIAPNTRPFRINKDQSVPANLLWTQKACKSGVRYDLGESVMDKTLFEHRMVERLMEAGLVVGFDTLTTVKHLVAQWTHDEER